MFNSDMVTGVIVIFSLSFLALAIVLIFIAMRSSLEESRKIKARLAGDVPKKDDGIFKKGKAFENLGNYISLPDENEITKIRFELMQAGYFSASAVKTFFAARLICLFLPQFFLLAFWGKLTTLAGLNIAIVIACSVTLTGFLAPQYFIRWRKGRRTDQVRKGFPDMMDLLVACIEAGLSLNAGLLRVSDEIGERYPALKINLDLLNMELRAGRDRHEGMQNFANRIGLDEAKALSVMLKQAEEMGASMGEALRTFSEEMRHKRLMKAEEKAMALSAKLTVPLIVFIFPAIMAMLLLPAGVRLARGFVA